LDARRSAQNSRRAADEKGALRTAIPGEWKPRYPTSHEASAPGLVVLELAFVLLTALTSASVSEGLA